MTTYSIQNIASNNPAFPTILLHISQPPEMLYIKSHNWSDLLTRPKVAIVGSRRATPYGKQITTQVACELARAGIVIVSGLAIGIDSIAHRAALEAGGLTIAVLPAGLDSVYPSSNVRLAHVIVEQGGALVTEYPPGSTPYKGNFVARNRIVSGMSNVLLVTEAAEKSGTLHTADFALEQGREVCAMPGPITAQTSQGTNNLIKAGASLVSSANDILNILGVRQTQNSTKPVGSTPHEQLLIDLIYKGAADGALLLQQSGLDVAHFNQALTMLEITGVIRALGANQWGLAGGKQGAR